MDYNSWAQFVHNWHTIITSVLVGFGVMFFAWGAAAIQAPMIFISNRYRTTEKIVGAGMNTALFGLMIIGIALTMMYWFRH